MRQYLIYDGEDSRDYGVYISGSGVFNAPSRAYDYLEIAGRNGSLIGFEKRLENIEVTYPAFIYTNFKKAMEDFRSFLLSRTGYCRLIDSYNPNEYRMASFAGGLTVEPTAQLDAGSFDIVFNCKPQRFLLSGEEVRTFTADGTIINPTRFPSAPFIRVYGAGVLGIGDQSITISEADVYTDIDCEIMEAFKGTQSRNQYITNSGIDFPRLESGSTGISLGSGITRVEITPRWFVV